MLEMSFLGGKLCHCQNVQIGKPFWTLPKIRGFLSVKNFHELKPVFHCHQIKRIKIYGCFYYILLKVTNALKGTSPEEHF